MTPDAVVMVTGGETLVGQAIRRRLVRAGVSLVPAEPQEEPRLSDPAALDAFFRATRPSHVVLTGGPMGGIAANLRWPADLMRENLLIATHVIAAAHRAGIANLLFLSSSCSYPRLCPQPMREADLLSGPVEPTSQAYATAKRAGMVLCRAYVQQYGVRYLTAIPATPYGPGDDFRPEEGHVIPALMARFHAAKIEGQPEVVVWGSGRPRREFIFMDDLADACLLVMDRYEEPDPINLGTGEDCSVAELATLVQEVVGYAGRLRFDTDRPDGTPLKRLDDTRLRELGWSARTPLRQGLEQTYRWYLDRIAADRDQGGE